MPENTPVSAEALDEAVKYLDRLAEAEYGAAVKDLLGHDDPVPGDEYQTMEVQDSHDAVWRVGRLIGITVKEPFATASAPSRSQVSQTGARRVWTLKDKTLNLEHPDWWQYQLITGFLATEDRAGDFDWLPPKNLPESEQVAWFLQAAHSERGVFSALAKSARKYLCNNPDVKSALASSEGSAEPVGVAADQKQEDTHPTMSGRISANEVQTAAVAVTQTGAAVIVAAIPWLGGAMVPVVAGLLLIVAARGLNGFCSRTVPSPVGGVVET